MTILPADGAGCRAVTDILARVGDKWTVLVVVALREGPRRFSTLRRDVSGISPQMLTTTLKALARDGLALRTIRATTPPQVSYELTPLGHSLAGAVRLLAKWSIDNMPAIRDNRERYDEQEMTSS